MSRFDDFSHAKFGIGVLILFLAIVFVVVLIVLDLTGVLRQAEPPPFLSDFVPAKQEACSDVPGGVLAVQESNRLWHGLGWPGWPAPVAVECDVVHARAAAGVVRWHSCDSELLTGEQFTAPCLAPDGSRKSSARVHLHDDGFIEAVDIYILGSSPTRCKWPHEEGHARGFSISPEEDALTPHVDGAHTERSGHLMAENCGSDLKWLDRNPGGDWPYAVQP